MKEKIVRVLARIRPNMIRALCCAFIFSFLLPYVDVMGCTTKKMSTYNGYQLIRGGPAALYVLTIVIFLAILILSFYKKEASRALEAFAASWRAITAALGGLIIGLLPGLQFLFDGVFMRVGQALGMACAAAVFIDGMAVSIAGYFGLAGIREGAAAYSKPLLKYHAAVMAVSLCLVPVYFFGLHEDIGLGVIYFLSLSLPFSLSQLIVMEGVRRNERWTRYWAVAVSFLIAGGVVLSVLNVM
jgi:hypothetical protein